MNENLRVLRAEPRFSRLLAASFISGIGDWFNTVAVLSLLFTLTGWGIAVGITLALRVFPRLLVGPLAGVLADRFPRKTILALTDLASAGLALGFLFATAPRRVWVVYACTVGLVILSIINQPAWRASLPMLVRPENLLVANALSGTVSGSVMVIGAVLGGVASGALGVEAAFVINSLTFLASAMLTFTIRFPVFSPAVKPGLTALWEVWPVVRGSRVIQAILLLAVLWPLGGGVINVLLSVYAVKVFDAGDAGVGILYGAVGLGLLTGGLLVHRISHRLRHALLAAFVVEGAGHALISQSPNLALAAVLLVVATAGAGIGNAGIGYLLMRAVPQQALGRMSALQGALASVTFGLSLLLAGVLLEALPPRSLGLLAGLFIMGAGLVGGLLLWSAELTSASANIAEEEYAEG
jgi:MFS family permease